LRESIGSALDTLVRREEVDVELVAMKIRLVRDASFREVIDDTTAVFVEPDHAEKLAATINDLLNDEAQMSALGAAALQRVERFT